MIKAMHRGNFRVWGLGTVLCGSMTVDAYFYSFIKIFRTIKSVNFSMCELFKNGTRILVYHKIECRL